MFINIHILYRYHTVNRFIPQNAAFSSSCLRAILFVFALAPYQLHSKFTFISRYFLIFLFFFFLLFSLILSFFPQFRPTYTLYRNKDNGKMKLKMKNWRMFPSITHSQLTHYLVYCDAMFLNCEPQKITKSDTYVRLFVCSRINSTFNRLMRQQQRPMWKSHKMVGNNTTGVNMCKVWWIWNKIKDFIRTAFIAIFGWNRGLCECKIFRSVLSWRMLNTVKLLKCCVCAIYMWNLCIWDAEILSHSLYGLNDEWRYCEWSVCMHMLENGRNM